MGRKSLCNVKRTLILSFLSIAFYYLLKVDTGVKAMKGLMHMLPTPGKNRVSADEGFHRMFHVLPVSAIISLLYNLYF